MKPELKQIIADLFELDEEQIKENLTPQTIELWDSMNHLRLITAVEEEFKIKFTMDEIQSIFDTHLGKLHELIEQHLNSK